jgi:hypothetical protein
MNKKKVQFKLSLVIISALLFGMIPVLLVSNTGRIVNNQLPKTSSVSYLTLTADARGVFVSGNYAYVAASASGLAIIDISDPINPGTPIYEDTTGGAVDVYVSGNYAYIADASSGLAIIDVSDPINPGTPMYEDTTVDVYACGNNIREDAVGVCVSGDFAYLAIGGTGLAIIDISDPTDLGTTIIAPIGCVGASHDVYVSGNFAYVANTQGLAIVDISDPTNPGTPVYIDTTETATGNANGVDISGNYAYIANGGEGLAIIDISDPTNPGTPVYQETTGSATDVHVSGDYAYVTDYDSGLAIIDVSDPTNPGEPVYKDTTGRAVGVHVSGNYAYVGDRASGLAIVDLLYQETVDGAIPFGNYYLIFLGIGIITLVVFQKRKR